MTQPAPFVDADFQPLETFVLRWRWTESRYNILPPEALAATRPFTPQRAREVWKWSDSFLDLSKAPGELAFSNGAFAAVRRLDTSTQDAPAHQWLASQGVEGNPEIIVSWQPDWAVLTQWSIFCRYWDDFCYPMSDDIVIWPPSEEWALVYWHEEELIFSAKDTQKEAAASAAQAPVARLKTPPEENINFTRQ